jgi:metallo-beta-lactamase class B
MIVRNSNEVIVFNTPTKNKSAKELIDFLKGKLHCKIIAVIPTHFHEDCLGGLEAFHSEKITSFGNNSTIELTKANNTIGPQKGFTDSLKLRLGNTYAIVKYFGEGHTKDNVVGYFPSEKILFGGCLIKELKATKGYLGDANLSEWSNTVEKVKQEYPHVNIVIPGHGKIGGISLLDYTIKLFKSR